MDLPGRQYKASYYTRPVEDGEWTLLFNGVTSALMRLPPDLAEELAPFLGPPRPLAAGRGLDEWDPPRFGVEDLPADLEEVFPELLRARFFVPADEDEIAFLKRRNEFTRRNDPFLLTITTTLDCNFDCYYCYEDKSPVYLSRERCDQILDYVAREVEAKGHPKLFTEWYGGEPMLNREAIEYFSPRAIAFCDRRGIGYSAGMISNGTHWPEDAAGFVRRHRINHVQITLDGPRRHHETRRAYKPGHEQEESSFDVVTGTIDRLLGSTRIYLRVNVDPGVGRAALELVDLFAARGWLAKGARVSPYLAPIGPMTQHCGELGRSERFRDFQDEFERIKAEFQALLARHVSPRDIEHLQIYPSTRRMNCAAVGDNSVVFGPDGLMYKCGLDVGVPARAFDSLPPPAGEDAAPPAVGGGAKRSPFIILGGAAAPGSQAHPYGTYDPFSHERCGKCQYLPVCMGGCPKTWFEGNDFYLARRSAYWENNFEGLIRTYAQSGPLPA